MSKKCIRCGAELPDHAKFCDKCGAAVSEQKQPCYCQKCGAKLDPGTKFCGSCGTPVGGSTGQEFQQFADNAKAAAQAGMDSAKKGAAKGMAYAAEKMAAAAEKMKQLPWAFANISFSPHSRADRCHTIQHTTRVMKSK